MEKSGFLSKDISKYKAVHRKNNEQIFKICEDLNKYAHDTMWKIKVSNEYLPEILSACAFVRTLSNFQSVVILSEYGLSNEAKIILRSLVEAMFLMVAIEKDREYSVKIIEQDILERERTYKAIKRNIVAGIHKLEKPTLDEVEDKIRIIQQEISDKGIKNINKREMSIAADLESFYDTIYHLLSGSVHINPRDLEQYLGLTEERKIKDIKWGPDEKDIEDILFAAVEVMIFVLKSISNMFEITLDGNWETIHKEYLAMGEVAIK